MESSKLDFESEDFDPQEALTVNAEAVKLPVPEAKVYNHLDEYEKNSFARKLEPARSSVRQKVKRATMPEESVREVQKTLRSVKPRREPRTVLTIVKTMTGPMAFLRKCMNRRVRVVLRRRKINFHGCDRIANLYGHLVIFDKHGNLVLKNVEEKIKINNPAPSELSRSYKVLFVRGSNIVLVNLLNQPKPQ